MNKYCLDRIDQIKKSCSCRGMQPFCVNCSAAVSFELKKEKANIPIRYRQLSLDNITSELLKGHKQLIVDYVNNPDLSQNFFFYNGQNTTKTAIGCIMLMELLTREKSCYFTSMDKLMSATVYGEQEFVDKIKEVDFLLINDLGDENRPESGVMERILENVLKERMYQMRPTIITSTKTLDHLNKHFGIDIDLILDNSLKIVRF